MTDYTAHRILELRGERPTRPAVKFIPTEHQEQVALREWWDRIECRKHRLEPADLFAIPNAGAGPLRGQAGKLKAEGLRAGIPDLCLTVPAGKYHGMYIEMKRRGKSATESQRYEMARLERRGYFCVTCDSADRAMAEIRNYLRP